jgi:hypothetical protein
LGGETAKIVARIFKIIISVTIMGVPRRSGIGGSGGRMKRGTMGR